MQRVRRQAERIRSRHEARKRALDAGSLLFFQSGSGITVRLDGGPGSGNFGHAGIPGTQGGSLPNGGAGCSATAERTEKLESALSSQSASVQADYLVRSGIVPAGEADALKDGAAGGDEEALQKIEEYREKYFEEVKQAYMPKESISSEERDRVAAMSDEEAQEWVEESADRNLTAEEQEWANPYNDLQKVVIDMDLTDAPQVVCKEDFDAYVEENGATVIYRGVTDNGAMDMSAANIIYQTGFEDGKAYMGSGVFGNGLYFSEYQDTADFYSRDDESGVMTCAVRSDAKILDFYSDEVNDLQDRVQNEDSSIGAICAGYDIVQVEDYYIVLNRAALIMQDPMDSVAEEIISSAES